MSQIQITLRINRETGKKDILIELESDADYTNWEHDQRHREVVEALIEKGIMNETEVGDVTVERIRPVPGQPASESEKPEQEPPTATPQARSVGASWATAVEALTCDRSFERR